MTPERRIEFMVSGKFHQEITASEPDTLNGDQRDAPEKIAFCDAWTAARIKYHDKTGKVLGRRGKVTVSLSEEEARYFRRELPGHIARWKAWILELQGYRGYDTSRARYEDGRDHIAQARRIIGLLDSFLQ